MSSLIFALIKDIVWTVYNDKKGIDFELEFEELNSIKNTDEYVSKFIQHNQSIKFDITKEPFQTVSLSNALKYLSKKAKNKVITLYSAIAESSSYYPEEISMTKKPIENRDELLKKLRKEKSTQEDMLQKMLENPENIDIAKIMKSLSPEQKKLFQQLMKKMPHEHGENCKH